MRGFGAGLTQKPQLSGFVQYSWASRSRTLFYSFRLRSTSPSKAGGKLSPTGAGAVGARDDIVLERERVCAVWNHEVAGLVECS